MRVLEATQQVISSGKALVYGRVYQAINLMLLLVQ